MVTWNLTVTLLAPAILDMPPPRLDRVIRIIKVVTIYVPWEQDSQEEKWE